MEQMNMHRSAIIVKKDTAKRIKELVNLKIFKNVSEFLRFVSLFQLLKLQDSNPDILRDLDTLAEEIAQNPEMLGE